jgi:hypothetical protein
MMSNIIVTNTTISHCYQDSHWDKVQAFWDTRANENSAQDTYHPLDTINTILDGDHNFSYVHEAYIERKLHHNRYADTLCWQIDIGYNVSAHLSTVQTKHILQNQGFGFGFYLHTRSEVRNSVPLNRRSNCKLVCLELISPSTMVYGRLDIFELQTHRHLNA